MPTIEEILAQAGTIPFNPNSGQSQVSNNLNPLALLDQLLNQQQNSIPQQKPNIVQGIIQALGQGVGVATSQNPGQALLGQLNAQKEMDFAKQQLEQRRIDEQNKLRQQVLLQTVQDQLAEQRQIRAEGRAEQASVRKDKRSEDAAVREFNLQMAGKEKLANIDFENSKKLADIKFKFEDQQLKSNQDFQQQMAALQAKDRRTSEIADTAVKLISLGASSEAAYSIARKVMNDEKLTPSETKAIDKGVRTLELIKHRGSGGEGGTSASTKMQLMDQRAAFQLFQEFAKTPYAEITNQDGSKTIVEAATVKDPLTGGYGDKVRLLSPQQGAEYAAQTVLPAMTSFMNPQKQQQVQISGSRDQVFSQILDAQIANDRKSGIPDSEIYAELNAQLKKRPDAADAIRGALIRNKLIIKEQKKTEKPTIKSRQDILNEAPSSALILQMPGQKKPEPTPIEKLGTTSKVFK